MEIKSKSITAFKWNVLSQTSNQLLILIVNIFLVRLLTPEEFGWIGLPFVIFSFMRMLQDFGYADILIKEKEVDVNLSSSIYWLIVFGGILFTTITFFTSHFVGKWSGEAVTVEITKWFSICILLCSFQIGFDAMLRKDLNFKLTFYTEFFANLFAGILGVYLAMNGWSWKALVIRFILQYGLQLFFTFLFSPWKPSFYFNYNLLKPHFSFATYSIGEQLINFLNRNIDTIFISKYIGSFALGIYDRAYKLLLFPLQQVSSSFSKVMLPAFANVQDNKAFVGTQFLKITRLVSLTTFPLMLGLFSVCDEFVEIVFGNQWIQMIPVLKMFCIISIFQSISTLSGSIFAATNNIKPYAQFSMVTNLIGVLVIFFSVIYYKDIYYVALCISVYSLLKMIPLWNLISKHLYLNKFEIWKSILPQLLASIVMMAAVFASKQILHTKPDIFNLILLVFIGAITYFIFLIGTKNKAYTEAKSLIMDNL